ncbi:energy-coupling factor transporter transmembrane protein EcfT (plasmid) [Streptomyces sp. NBC_01591]|uniref:energy-coupling factor transporter transmembrane component T family protein n=1 Tax=Streptomyces sp. NBC_01591 TaxID=2975888 RepID=UPI002DDB14E6|nr:energy-coupling factor transporter transmembrane component T [Streptomyces sp. NBC_01591]WSD74032.1 energy-coupling factor transporter transmembrane protein EcfT [Streptomyces sp. NBC_01591]
MHRLNPVTKLVFALTTTVAAFALTMVWWPLLLLTVTVLPAVLAAGVLRRFLRLMLVFYTPVLVVVFLIQGLFFPEPSAIVAQWGPLSVKQEGLIFAAQTSLRILVLMGGFFFLMLTTHPGTLMSAMAQRGMSSNTGYVVSTTLQIIPAFRGRAQSILRAQQARGLELRTARQRARALLPMVGPLILGAFAEVEERAAAMEARAFGATRKPTALVPVPDTRAQRAARIVMCVIAAGAVAVNVLGVVR